VEKNTELQLNAATKMQKNNDGYIIRKFP